MSSADISTAPFSINGRDYAPPAKPLVGICIDGCADEYLDAAMVRGRMPHFSRLVCEGFRGLARAALPTFTNVNNASIATGVPPSRHGISGNFFFDPETGEEVMMNHAGYLRCETIFAAAENAGQRVACVTAKEKLRDMLAHGLNSGIAFSAERADQATVEHHGIGDVEQFVGRSTPAIYSAEASLFVLAAGVALLEQRRADLIYLSLTDYMQHTYSPDAEPALEFYQAMDALIGRLMDLGALVGATADHGMNAKCDAQGMPRVTYLKDELDRRFDVDFRLICPITDPYVVHHGALGSYVTVHCPPGVDLGAVANYIADLPGVTEVALRDQAARRWELPADRIGDITVLAGRDVVLGRTRGDHDLSQLHGTLRSHGGRYEEIVPWAFSRPLSDNYVSRCDPRNFELFDFLCNGLVE